MTQNTREEAGGGESVLSITSEEDLRVLLVQARGEGGEREVTTAPDLEVPLSGERLMAASNR